MVIVKLIPVAGGAFRPLGGAELATLRSFGYFDEDVREARTLDEWKRERARTGGEGVVRLLVPA